MKHRIAGMIIGTIAMLLACHYYDWKLALIIWLAIWGDNLETLGMK
jgi:hypothetical protein